MKGTIEAPVLLIAFNRPDTTQIVFNSIREAKPKKLYVAIDGPRSHKAGENHLCEQVLEITEQVDWECDAKYLIRDNNLGCKLGVTSAISWVFENEDRAIIIEDDIVAVPSFFYFAEELLDKYKHDNVIAMISGNNYTPFEAINSDYVFTKYGHIWGWATWKRVWDRFDVQVPELNETISNGFQNIEFLNTREKKYHENYFRELLSNIKNESENAWGPQFVFFRRLNDMLSIAPNKNLASNIGTTSSRTDHIAKTNEHYFPAVNDFVLVKHPVNIECNIKYDNYHFKKHINKNASLFKRIYHKAMKILNSKKVF